MEPPLRWEDLCFQLDSNTGLLEQQPAFNLLNYWAPSSLSRYAGTGTCVSSCIFKHVNIPPSTTRFVLLSEGKIASMCV